MKLRLTMQTLTIFSLLFTYSAAKETKDILFKFKHADPVIFSHDIHLDKYDNNCRICHNAIFNIKNPRHFSMTEMEKTKSCGACHTGVRAFSVSSEKDCVRCHRGKIKNINYRRKGAPEAVFSHDIHRAKIGDKCMSCHNGKVVSITGKRVSMDRMEDGQSCGVCHNGKTAFTVAGNCSRCHKGFKPPDLTFRNEGGDVRFSHELHLGMYKCPDCHTGRFPFRTGVKHFRMNEMEAGSSCGGCHNGKDAFSVKENCDKCHKM